MGQQDCFAFRGQNEVERLCGKQVLLRGKVENDSTAFHTLISLNVVANLNFIKQYGSASRARVCVPALFNRTGCRARPLHLYLASS